MKLKYLLLVFIFVSIGYCQVKDLSIGSATGNIQQRQGGYYDYSRTNTLNMEVAIWGFVRYPGKYLIPVNTTIIDLISYAGGPTEDAELEDIRLYRVDPESGEETILSYNYNKLLWNDSKAEMSNLSADLKASDVVAVTGGQRLYFKDWTSITLSVFSALVSLAILIINLTD